MPRLLLAAALLAGCATQDDPPTMAELGLFGPENTWYHADLDAVPEAPADGRFAVGQAAPDLKMPDQLGQAVQLYQFYGRPVLIDVLPDHGTMVEEISEECTG